MVDLNEAGRRLRDYRPEPTPDVMEIERRRSRRRRRRSVAGAAGVVVLAGAVIALALALTAGPAKQRVVTSPTATTAAAPTTSPPVTAAAEKATFTITLDHTTVPAGTTIHGVVTVDNETGAPLPIPGGKCNGWPTVGLSNDKVSYIPVSGGVGCGLFAVPVGQSRYPITVLTTYTSCTQTPADEPSSDPVCPDGVLPALPASTYHTVVEEAAGMGVNTVTVTLTTPQPAGSAVTSPKSS
jgi:hypothetical protein